MSKTPLWIAVWIVFIALFFAVCVLAPIDREGCVSHYPVMVPGMPKCGGL
jgi:hypothetical protein